MSDAIASAFLFFDNGWFLIPLVLLAYLWLDQPNFYQAICLMLLCILFNVALKVSFQVPLAPFLEKEGFAFPSGHMQLASVFYLWLAYQLNKGWFYWLLSFLLAGIGYGLIHFGYHNLYDVLAALFFALVLLAAYHFVLWRWPRALNCLVFLFATCLLAYIALRYGKIESHVWMAYYCLCGLLTAESLTASKARLKLLRQKILASLVSVLAIAAIYVVFDQELRNSSLYLYQLQWLCMGFSLPWSRMVAAWLLKSE